MLSQEIIQENKNDSIFQILGDLGLLGSKESGWTQRIGEGAPVEVRIGDQTYAVRAERAAQQDWEPIFEAYVAKYEPDYPEIVAGLLAEEDPAGVGVIFRLSRDGGSPS